MSLGKSFCVFSLTLAFCAEGFSRSFVKGRAGRQIQQPSQNTLEQNGKRFFSMVRGLDFHLARKLLEQDNTLLEYADSNGLTILHIAVSSSAGKEGEAFIKFLLQKNKDLINARDEWGRTPLHMTKSPTTINLLIENGASVKAENKFGQTPLQAALRSGDMKVAEALAKHEGSSSAKSKGKNSKKPSRIQSKDLMELVREGSEKDVLEAVEKGVDVSVKDKLGRGLVHEAVAFGRERLVIELVKREVPLESDANLRTPLHEAVRSENKKIIDALSKAEGGRLLNEVDFNRMTPFQLSFSQGRLGAAKVLIEKNPQMNLRDRAGNTLFHTVRTVEFLDIITQDKIPHIIHLLSSRNKQGRTPIEEAIHHGREDVVKRLEEWEKNYTDAFSRKHF